MHGAPSAGAPRGNQHALKHGRYSLVQVLLKREAREARNRARTLALAVQFGFSSIDDLMTDIFARLDARRAYDQ
jgi:hypothetical protein